MVLKLATMLRATCQRERLVLSTGASVTAEEQVDQENLRLDGTAS